MKCSPTVTSYCCVMLIYGKLYWWILFSSSKFILRADIFICYGYFNYWELTMKMPIVSRTLFVTYMDQTASPFSFLVWVEPPFYWASRYLREHRAMFSDAWENRIACGPVIAVNIHRWIEKRVCSCRRLLLCSHCICLFHSRSSDPIPSMPQQQPGNFQGAAAAAPQLPGSHDQ